MDFTASIVVHKPDSRQLKECLESLVPEGAAVTVIDNSPEGEALSDKAPDLMNDSLFSGVEYIRVENRGFGAGHNVAIRKALDRGSKWHLVLNADVWWRGDVVRKMIGHMKSDPEIGMMMPKVFYPDGMLQFAHRMLPTPFDLFAKRFLPQCLIKKRMRRYLLADIDPDLPLDTPYLLGSFLLFRTEALRKEGLFDERFFMYPEDIDITRRIHRNWKTMYWPEVEIVHAHAAASRKSGRMLRIHIENMIRYFNKWGWIFDSERRKMNKRLRRDAQPSGYHVNGRG